MMFVVMLLNLAFYFLDYYTMPLSFFKVAGIRSIMVLEEIILLLMLFFFQRVRRHMSAVFAILIILFGINITLMIAVSQPEELGHQVYYIGLALLVIFFPVSGLLQIKHAFIVTSTVIVVHIFMLVFYLEMHRTFFENFISNIVFLTSGMAISIFTGLTFDRYLKNDFIQKKVIQQRQDALEKEIKTASDIQRSILPGNDVYRNNSLVISARYLPMVNVGGDFYDFIQINDHTVGLIIADVSGHGVAAALISSMVKISFHSAEALWDRPDEILQKINRDLCAKTGASFITAAYLCLNLKEKKAALAQAGHPPLYLHHRQSGQIELHKPDGFPLAIFPKTEYLTQVLDLHPGDRLFFCTDGLYDALERRGSVDGEEGVMECLRTVGAKGSSSALESIEGKLELRAHLPKDDITMVIVDIESL